MQYYEVVIRQEGDMREFVIEAKNHTEAIKQFKTFVKQKGNRRPHYSELFYRGQFLSYVHFMGNKIKEKLNDK